MVISVRNRLMATFLCATATLFLLITETCCLEKSGSNFQQDPKHKKLLFVFGDSLFDVGNNQYLNTTGSNVMTATMWPYGMNNHNHSTGRLSDGLLVPDFIALNAKLGLLPPYMQPGANFSNGANFASAGAGVFDTHQGVINLRAQMENFKKVVASMEQNVGKSETKNTLMRSVFMFSAGGNDYFSFYVKNPNITESQRREYIKTLLGNLTTDLKAMYNMGLRKIAFQSVGPMGCYPMARSLYPEYNNSCVPGLQTLAAQHNRALAAVLNNLKRKLPGFKYAVFDYFNALGDRILHPAKYGFKVGLVACCGNGAYNCRNCGGGNNGTAKFSLCSNPSEYVLFDGGHHTQRTNIQLSGLFWSGAGKTTAPLNLKQLFEAP